MSQVQLSDVSKVHRSSGGDVVAVNGVTLRIGTGERVGIIGPNGAGKSTLLQLIAGLAEPTSGSVRTTGHVTAIMTLGVGMREHATGRDNIYLDGELQQQSRAQVDAVIDDVIAFSELGEFIDQPVRTYSTGMKARLAFSMLCHIDPDILIIDETLSVGDAAFSRKATAKIGELCARGKVVILVSHSMTAIRDICNRCLWLDAGRVVMDGDPVQVTDGYIEAVRHADQAESLARFRASAGHQSLRTGWDLDVSLQQGGDNDRQLLEPGTSLRVRLSGRASRDGNVAVRVDIVRLDGLRMFSERCGGSEIVDDDGRVLLDLWMEPLVLAPGFYRVDAALLAGGESAATCSIVCEVYSPLPPSGGKPMLIYPIVIDTAPTTC